MATSSEAKRKKLSAVKRTRQNEKRRLRNRAAKSKLKTLGKQVENAIIDGKNEDEIMVNFKNYVSYVDNIAGKRIIHMNNAARKKSRLYKRIKLAVSQNK